MRRAYTLIELMICVGMFGIIAAIAMVAPQAPLLESHDVVVKERVRQWLDYEGAGGADANVIAGLRAQVPGGALTRTSLPNNMTRLTVTWHRPGGRDGERSVVVVGGRR